MINKYDLQMKLFNIYCFCDIFTMWINSKKSAEKISFIQNKKLNKLIHQAYNNPFYKERFKKAGVFPDDIRTPEDLNKLPILTKEEYRHWMLEELKSDEAKHYKTTQTSGSTGIPTTNIYPPKEYAQHYMMDMFCWIMGGYNPFFGKTLTCSPGDANVGTNSFIQKLGILRRDCYSMKWDRSKIIEKINTYQPDFILGNSSILSYIARYALDNNINIHKPNYYCAGGEHVMGEQEKVLKAVFGKSMINYYGCTEMADFAYRKPGEDVYRIIQDCVVLNINTEDGIKNRGTGSILATPLYRTRYPLINYEMGDIVTLEKINGVNQLTEIKGRIQDVFYWKSGNGTTFIELWTISRSLENIYQIRFIQESYTNLTIQLVQDKYSNKTKVELEEHLNQLFEPLIDEDVKITYEWFDEIPPDPNGKIRNMISRIK